VLNLADPFACAPRQRDRYGALIALLNAGLSGSLLQEIAGQLVRLDLAGSGTDEPGRDRPARQRLRIVVEQASRWAIAADPDRDITPLTAAGRYLAGQADLTLAAATLNLAAVRFTDSGAQHLLSDQLLDVCGLLEDHPVTAAHLADAVTRRLSSDKRADPEMILPAAEALSEHGTLSTGLLAVALATYGAQLGWPDPWRAQIRELRKHPHPDVRAAGLATVTAAE